LFHTPRVCLYLEMSPAISCLYCSVCFFLFVCLGGFCFRRFFLLLQILILFMIRPCAARQGVPRPGPHPRRRRPLGGALRPLSGGAHAPLPQSVFGQHGEPSLSFLRSLGYCAFWYFVFHRFYANMFRIAKSRTQKKLTHNTGLHIKFHCLCLGAICQ